MAGMIEKITPNENNDRIAKANMMDLWRQSMERNREKRETVSGTLEARKAQAEIDRKIRSGEMECPTCTSRTYKDGSDDTSVSFQTPGHIGPTNAAATVMRHEMEHVMNESSEAEKEGGNVRQSVVLHRDICPTCGRTYVSGGTTSTAKTVPVKREDGSGALDLSV